MFAVRDILIFGVAAGVLAAVVLTVMPWARRPGRSVAAGLSTVAGFIAWNLTLNATNAPGFNADAPVVFVSWADAGSGVLAFAATSLVLGLVTEGHEPAGRVVGAAGLGGLSAILVDLFVL